MAVLHVGKVAIAAPRPVRVRSAPRRCLQAALATAGLQQYWRKFDSMGFSTVGQLLRLGRGSKLDELFDRLNPMPGHKIRLLNFIEEERARDQIARSVGAGAFEAKPAAPLPARVGSAPPGPRPPLAARSQAQAEPHALTERQTRPRSAGHAKPAVPRRPSVAPDKPAPKPAVPPPKPALPPEARVGARAGPRDARQAARAAGARPSAPAAPGATGGRAAGAVPIPSAAQKQARDDRKRPPTTGVGLGDGVEAPGGLAPRSLLDSMAAAERPLDKEDESFAAAEAEAEAEAAAEAEAIAFLRSSWAREVIGRSDATAHRVGWKAQLVEGRFVQGGGAGAEEEYESDFEEEEEEGEEEEGRSEFPDVQKQIGI